MKVDFNINGVSEGHTGVPTDIEGERVNAFVPALEVELIGVSSRSGSLTLRLIGAQIAEGRETFKPGTVITADFTAKAAETKAPEAKK